MSGSIQCNLQPHDSWVEIFPYGVTFGADRSRPILLFKDRSEKQVLPVWLSPLDAGIAISQHGRMTTASSPHNLTWKMLEPLGVKLKQCLFVEVKGHHQFVELEFEGSSELNHLRSRADEAMSFCLSAKTRFFCRPGFFDECRILEGEMADMASGAGMQPGFLDTQHPYLL